MVLLMVLLFQSIQNYKHIFTFHILFVNNVSDLQVPFQYWHDGTLRFNTDIIATRTLVLFYY